MVRMLFRLPLCLGLWLAAAACAAEPMTAVTYGDIGKAQEIIVLLPGIKDRAGVFADEGFVAAAQPQIQNHRLALVAADAHFGYYRARTVYERLYVDILQKLPPDKPVTLAGISLGGFGALGVARRYPERVRRLVLFAPFLGELDFIEQVRQEGLAARRRDDEFERELLATWHYLGSSRARPQIEVLYGAHDKFAPAYALLRSKNPQLSLRTLDGGHDWETWLALWRSWLKQRS